VGFLWGSVAVSPTVGFLWGSQEPLTYLADQVPGVQVLQLLHAVINLRVTQRGRGLPARGGSAPRASNARNAPDRRIGTYTSWLVGYLSRRTDQAILSCRCVSLSGARVRRLLRR